FNGLPTVFRIGDGVYNVCSFSEDDQLPPSLVLPAGLTIRSDHGPGSTRIVCDPEESSPALQQVVLLEPGSALIGVDVDCGPLCQLSNKPAIRVISGDNASSELAFVTATGGDGVAVEVDFETSDGMPIAVSGEVRISHSLFYASDTGVQVHADGGDGLGTVTVNLFDTIFRDCENGYVVESASGEVSVDAYDLNAASNHMCGVVDPADESGDSPSLTGSLIGGNGTATCGGCIPSPATGAFNGALIKPSCVLFQAGTDFEPHDGGAFPSDIGPVQGATGCGYSLFPG
ncbi:MAG: hypothetical protein QF464_01920, partial [Myxococcota bacterium]|nr:hypothetical protein [Myxococcota bacterium]